jgi:hypothetical protein
VIGANDKRCNAERSSQTLSCEELVPGDGIEPPLPDPHAGQQSARSVSFSARSGSCRSAVGTSRRVSAACPQACKRPRSEPSLRARGKNPPGSPNHRRHRPHARAVADNLEIAGLHSDLDAIVRAVDSIATLRTATALTRSPRKPPKCPRHRWGSSERKWPLQSSF